MLSEQMSCIVIVASNLKRDSPDEIADQTPMSRLGLMPIMIGLCVVETIEDAYEYRLESVSAAPCAMA